MMGMMLPVQKPSNFRVSFRRLIDRLAPERTLVVLFGASAFGVGGYQLGATVALLGFAAYSIETLIRRNAAPWAPLTPSITTAPISRRSCWPRRAIAASTSCSTTSAKR